eukprot:Blabericola_migrator_1__6710@NODE_3393_length_1812_cov_15_598281_g2113_i0_p1_GENE_NODE_3393_length_1812_cov_15_598281_g2113_i0NODE_3393_length_1812_cov_15_598281_g2113_i0_p1_ORF_typecomplete_len219_score36_40_NODE_3393_length_1812_cov_15_598281_g2113_i05041160
MVTVVAQTAGLFLSDWTTTMIRLLLVALTSLGKGNADIPIVLNLANSIVDECDKSLCGSLIHNQSALLSDLTACMVASIADCTITFETNGTYLVEEVCGSNARLTLYPQPVPEVQYTLNISLPVLAHSSCSFELVEAFDCETKNDGQVVIVGSSDPEVVSTGSTNLVFRGDCAQSLDIDVAVSAKQSGMHVDLPCAGSVSLLRTSLIVLGLAPLFFNN